MPCDTYASITGTFTDWLEHKMIKWFVFIRFDFCLKRTEFFSDGEYRVEISVPAGCHYYRILVNGRQRFISTEVCSNENDVRHCQNHLDN